jgi:hypothetical protein
MTLGYPLLSIDRIEASGEKLAADIRVAGRPDRVELSLEMPGVLGFARMPGAGKATRHRPKLLTDAATVPIIGNRRQVDEELRRSEPSRGWGAAGPV